ncbi:MAG: zinc ABC transporter substrate-binding protein, partial [Anaerolineae bacterium]|nr:zinc ABC transporter substrate-binding protein [Anaerolineae bacterium]
WTLAVRDTLSDLDPAHAEAYAANAAAYVAALQSLVDGELWPLVESLPAADRVLVTQHGSLGYFAAAFGFDVIGVVIPGGSTIAEPSAAEVAAIIDTVRAAGVPAVFAETTSNPDLVEQIARETGASFHTLYTGSLSEVDGPASTYLDYMRYNVGTIVTALSR